MHQVPVGVTPARSQFGLVATFSGVAIGDCHLVQPLGIELAFLINDQGTDQFGDTGYGANGVGVTFKQYAVAIQVDDERRRRLDIG